MERGALVPDDVTMQMIAERLATPDAAARRHPRRLPAHPPQAEALDRLLGSSGGRVAAALYIEVDTDRAGARLAGPAGVHRRRPPTSTTSIAAARAARHVRHRRHAARAARDDQPETISARLERQLPPMYEVVDHYAETRRPARGRGDQPIDEVTDELVRVVERAEKRA